MLPLAFIGGNGQFTLQRNCHEILVINSSPTIFGMRSVHFYWTFLFCPSLPNLSCNLKSCKILTAVQTILKRNSEGVFGSPTVRFPLAIKLPESDPSTVWDRVDVLCSVVACVVSPLWCTPGDILGLALGGKFHTRMGSNTNRRPSFTVRG